MPKKLKGPQTPEYWEARIRTRGITADDKARRMLCKEIAAWVQAARRKDPIVITYFGEDTPPKIECSAADRKRIKLVDGTPELSLFMDYKGVKIYTTLNQGCVSENWFSTIQDLSNDCDNEGMFDVRDLPNVPAEDIVRLNELFPEDRGTTMLTIAYAIEKGAICLDALV